jgi:anti-sigma regulatory factor (Ser/Thr protein kinase)
VSELHVNHLLAPDLASVVVVRRVVDELGLEPPRTGTVKLVVSELVTNSIEHGHLGSDEQIQVLGHIDGRGALHMEVRDPGPGPAADMLCGMGWRVLERVTDRWGFDRRDGLSRVWFELDPVPAAREQLGPPGLS